MQQLDGIQSKVSETKTTPPQKKTNGMCCLESCAQAELRIICLLFSSKFPHFFCRETWWHKYAHDYLHIGNAALVDLAERVAAVPINAEVCVVFEEVEQKGRKGREGRGREGRGREREGKANERRRKKSIFFLNVCSTFSPSACSHRLAW